jgi:signal transduction histidine kinase
MHESQIPSIKVLLIEDDEDDQILLNGLLGKVPLVRYEITWVQAYEDGLKELEKGIYDVCLLDYHLGSKTGLEILRKVAEVPRVPPIIILTGQGDHSVDLKAMEYGAADYLVKDQISESMLERTIRYSIDRKKSTEALQDSLRQNKLLASALLKVQESERKMLASTLHDELSQLLAAIKFRIEAALERMAPDEVCASNLKVLIPSVQDALEMVRNLYTQLLPTVLGDLGILATLKWFCREFQNSHPFINVESEFEVEEDEISADLKLAIFRIVEDAFQNAVDHKRFHRLQVNLVGRSNHVGLRIAVDGAGFDELNSLSEECTECGLRLISMKKRAELSGGLFEIGSSDAGWTLVSVQWPAAEQ